MKRLELHLFGTFQVNLGGEPLTGFRSDKVRALLAYLALAGGQTQRRQRLATLLWGEQPDKSANASLRVALHNLRQVLAPLLIPEQAPPDGRPLLTITRQNIQFDVQHPACWVDAVEFDALMAAQQTHLHRDPVYCVVCIQRMARMVELYRGELLSGLALSDSPAFDEWQTMQQEARHHQTSGVLRTLTAHYVALAEYGPVEHYARRQIELDPWNEEGHRNLMWGLAMDGRRAAALAQYGSCRSILQQELGVEPTEATTDLYQQIRDGELGWDAEAGGDARLLNPYKGLQPFEEADRDHFFGREALVDRLLARMGESGDAEADGDSPPTPAAWTDRFLAVIGPSGSGKSSVVRAGLIPALRRVGALGGGRWLVTTMFPGENPEAELSAALDAVLLPGPQMEAAARPGQIPWSRLIQERLPPETRLLLFVDQAEELFTLTRDDAARARFVTSLLTALQVLAGRLWLVAALRADYYDRPLRIPNWSRLFHQRHEITPPLTPEELERTITGPAARVGVSLEAGLVTRIVADVGDEPGALPLLQYALTELFERREGWTMTLAAYQAVGGLAGALVGRAEALYAGLSPEEQGAARQLFLRLVVSTDVVRQRVAHARRRVPQSELEGLGDEPGAMGAVTEAFSRHRLLTFDRDPATGQPTVEIAHEVLLEAWPRLRGWLEASRVEIRLYRRLATAAREWAQADRAPGFLVRGPRLDQFEALLTSTTGLALTPLESEYVQASLAGRRRRQAQEQARREREAALERRGRNRLRALVVVLSLAVVVALGLTAFALNQQRIAQREAALAHSLNLATSAQLALNEGDTDLALALALEANRMSDPPPQTQWMLAQAAYAPGTRRLLAGHTDPVQAVAVTSDGRRALSASADGSLILWELSSLEADQVLRRFVGHDDVVHDVVLLPGERQALSASADGGLILWDLNADSEDEGILKRLRGHDGAVRAVAALDDGRRALSASGDGSLILWDLETGAILRRFSGHRAAVLSLTVTPDGRRALSGAADGGLILWDLATGEALHRMAGQADTVAAVQPAEGETLDPTRGHFDAVWGVALMPDAFEEAGERTALSVSQDEYLVWWDLETGTRIKALHIENGLFAVAPGPYGVTALLGTLGNQVLLVDLESEQTLFRGYGHTGRVLSVALTPDGRGALSGATDGTLRLWELQSGAEVRQLFYPGSAVLLTDVDISPDGRLGLTAMVNNEIAVWDVVSGAEICRLLGHQDMPFAGAQFLPDTQAGTGVYRVISGSGDLFGPSEDNTVRLWEIDAAQGVCQQVVYFEGHTDRLWDVAVSPDGGWVASGSHDGTLRLWNLQSGEGKVLLDVSPQAVRSVAFSPDGELLAVGLAKGDSQRPDYGVRLIERATGREVGRLVGHGEVVADVAFSPDGERLLSASSDNVLILWDVVAKAEIDRLLGHTDSVVALAFHPGSRLAASGSTDASLIVWDTMRGEALRRYTGHTKAVLGLAFSPEGDRLFSAGDEVSYETVREWRIDGTQEELMAWIEANRYVPELTCQQREQYHVEPLCE